MSLHLGPVITCCGRLVMSDVSHSVVMERRLVCHPLAIPDSVQSLTLQMSQLRFSKLGRFVQVYISRALS